jgi:hypothetical protein
MAQSIEASSNPDGNSTPVNAPNEPITDVLTRLHPIEKSASTDLIRPKSFIKPAPTAWLNFKPTLKVWLNKAVLFLKSDNDEPGSNSDHDCPQAPFEFVSEWKDFPTAEDILSELEVESKEELERLLAVPEAYTMIWGDDVDIGGKVSEQAFERGWAFVSSGLNKVFRLLEAKQQNTDTPEYIVIGDGNCARKRVHSSTKKPDQAAYKHVPGSDQYQGNNPDQTECRIPGDAKLFRKIRHSMLPPNGSEFLDLTSVTARREAQKVCNQIYNYMDMHESRYGYIVNDEELIFFRRTGVVWGAMEVGPPIRHDVEGDMGNGQMNSKWVMLYFHHVIANGEKSLWHLPACLETVAKRTGPTRHAKGLASIQPKSGKVKGKGGRKGKR